MLMPSIVLGVLCVLLEIIYKIAQAVMYGVHWVCQCTFYKGSCFYSLKQSVFWV